MYKHPPKCVYCGKEIWHKGRCWECFQKAIAVMPKFCVDCGKRLCRGNPERCHSCSNKYLFKTGKLDNSGANHPNYKGGITPVYYLVRNLPEYREWRDKVYKRDSFTCQTCNVSKSGHLEAHHKKPFTIILAEFLKEYDQFSPIEDKETLVRLAAKYEPFWNINNGKTLCEDCHNLTKKGCRTYQEIKC